MRLLVISYKACWKTESGYATVGGFPFQMQAIAEAFDETCLMILESKEAASGLVPLIGKNLSVDPLPNIEASGLKRKLIFPFWLSWHLPKLLGSIWKADAVHALVPGDLGFIGLLLALIMGKKLFIRHCGTWGNRTTLADKLLMALLPRIAGGKVVVLATGAGTAPPAPNVEWIFSTSLSQAELEQMPPPRKWEYGQCLRLISLGRLSKAKNVAASIEALPLVRAVYPHIQFDILGDGSEMQNLQKQSRDLGLSEIVKFHGYLNHEEVMAALAHANLMLFPTRTPEGFPKAVIEALASAVPVIAPPVSVIPQLLAESRGIVLEENTPNAISAAVLSLIKDTERLNQMARNAQLFAKSYTLEAWGKRIAEILERNWHEPLY